MACLWGLPAPDRRAKLGHNIAGIAFCAHSCQIKRGAGVGVAELFGDEHRVVAQRRPQVRRRECGVTLPIGSIPALHSFLSAASRSRVGPALRACQLWDLPA